MEPESDNGFVFETLASDLLDTESGYSVRMRNIWTCAVAALLVLCYHAPFSIRAAGPC